MQVATPTQLRQWAAHKARRARMVRAPVINLDAAVIKWPAAEPRRWPTLVVNKVLIIQRIVADAYDVSVEHIVGPTRARSVIEPRFVAIFLCRQLTKRSLPEIGRRFGGRDHTTILNALRRISVRMMTDEDLAHRVAALMKQTEAAL